MFEEKEINIFNVNYENSCKEELCSKKTLFLPAPSIERKLSFEKKGNKDSRDEDIILMSLYCTFLCFQVNTNKDIAYLIQ